MKTIVYLITFIFSSICFSQGNLQFNQVKLVTGLETVPNGKVWKVESILYSSIPASIRVSAPPGYNVNPNNFEDVFIKINGSPIIARSIRANNNYTYNSTEASMNYTIYECKLPIWLSAGFNIEKTAPIVYISIIEFNIVP